jgi:hypothetical protein
MPAKKWTQEQREEALALVKEVGQAKAAAKTGIPKGTIAAWCYEFGVHTLARQNVQQAHEITAARNAALRAEIAHTLLGVAKQFASELTEGCYVYAFGGKSNDFTDATAKLPGPRDRQALLTSIGIALDKSVMLERHDADGGQGLAAVDEWLRGMLGR